MQPSCTKTNQSVTEQNSKTIEHKNKKPKIKKEKNSTTKASSRLNTDLKKPNTVVCTDLVDTKVAQNTVQKNSESIEKTDTIDLLKPLKIKPYDYDIEHSICNVEERYFNVKHFDSQDPNLVKPVESSISKDITVKEDLSPGSLSENDDDRKKQTNLPENQEIDKNTLEFCRMLKDFGDNATVVESNAAFAKIDQTQSEDDRVVNKAVLVHDPTDHDKGSHLTRDNAEVCDENSDDDLVYVSTYFLNDDSVKK